MPIADESVRFGVFEVDLRAAELRKRGIRVRLQEQPFQVLALLLERSGEVVTREELRRRLWPGDTFVDFEQGVNGAIKRLRRALGDSAEHPHLIETVPRRGYRFIATADTVRPVPSQGRRWWRREMPRRAVLSLVAVAGVMAAGFAGPSVWRRLRPRPAPSGITSIVVLPLKNVSGDPKQDLFADEMTAALISDLVRIDGLNVVGYGTMMRHKDARTPVPLIAQDVGAEAILEGSIAWERSRLRITVQLLDAKADRQLWAGSFDREMADVMGLQNELVRSVVAGMSLRVTPEESERLAVNRRVAPEAYQLYLEGRRLLSLWALPGDEGVARGIQHLRLSTNRDPSFAPAWAALAVAYGTGSLFGILPAATPGAGPKAAARRAIDLDPTLGEAQAALGLAALSYDRDRVQAEKHVRRGLELDPNQVPVLIQSSFVLSQLGRLDEAMALSRRAVDLDPLSSSTNLSLAFTLFCSRRYRDALHQLSRCRDLDPRSPWPWIGTAWAEARLGRTETATAAAGRARMLLGGASPSSALGILGWVYGTAGHPDEARALLRRLDAIRAPAWRDPYYIAYVQEGLGDTNAALDSLEQALREHSPSIARVLVDPTWSAATRAQPRYADLCRRAGIAESPVPQATVGAFSGR